jgi:hypothetical protein
LLLREGYYTGRKEEGRKTGRTQNGVRKDSGKTQEGLRKTGWKEGETQTGRSKEERKGRKVRKGETGRHEGRKPGTLKESRRTKNQNRTYYPPPLLLPRTQP